VARHPDLPFLEILGTPVIRDSRWRCEHGWDVNLDDGSTRYERWPARRPVTIPNG